MMRLIVPVLFLVACGGAAGEGEACEVTADCEEGLECHMHDGEGECHAEHDDEETDHTDHTDDTDH